MKKRVLFGIGVLGLVSLHSALAGVKNYAPHVEGEVVVKMKKGQKFLQKFQKLGLTLKQEMNLLSGNFLLLKSHSYQTKDLISELQTFSEIEYVEPNFFYRIVKNSPNIQEILGKKFGEMRSAQSPTDPMYHQLWGLKNTGNNEPRRSSFSGVLGADIDAEKAWMISKGSRDVVVAVIDTGIDYNHPDLSSNMWVNEDEVPGNGIDDDQNGYVDDIYGWNAQRDNGDPMDGHDHGTHCAGTIGASHNNGIGVAGVMSDVRLMAVKFLSDSGSGTLADAVEAIDYATRMKVDIMSNSWGGGGFSQALEDSIKRANEEGIIFVAAAGNSSSNNDSAPSYPASYQVENVISVASATAQDSLSSFSNYGRTSVHLAAPGSNILSTTKGNQYKVFSGTSMATPHVSGVVGLFLALNRSLPMSELKSQLMETSVPKSSYRRKVKSGGRVNAYQFLTDTRIPRDEPQESEWREVQLDETFETPHPYPVSTKYSKTLSFPGAKYIRLIVDQYDTETSFDFLRIKNREGMIVESLTGYGINFKTEYVEGESLTVEFTSDSTVTRWGVLITRAQVIY